MTLRPPGRQCCLGAAGAQPGLARVSVHENVSLGRLSFPPSCVWSAGGRPSQPPIPALSLAGTSAGHFSVPKPPCPCRGVTHRAMAQATVLRHAPSVRHTAGVAAGTTRREHTVSGAVGAPGSSVTCFTGVLAPLNWSLHCCGLLALPHKTPVCRGCARGAGSLCAARRGRGGGGRDREKEEEGGEEGIRWKEGKNILTHLSA